MRLEDLNWMDVESYLKTDDRIILVLGSCEQHGFLSLLTDVRIPQALADAASQESNVLVAPALNFGVSPYFLEFPGTISLQPSTYLAVFEDMLESLIHHGFKRILLLNGHGGNHVATTTCNIILNKHPHVQIRWYSWWRSRAVQKIYEKHNLKPGHGDWSEAFPFTIVSDIPDRKKEIPDVEGSISAEKMKELFPDGVMGNPTIADMAIMDELFKTALANILHLLTFED
jgi:creatinine amidohydrolase